MKRATFCVLKAFRGRGADEQQWHARIRPTAPDALRSAAIGMGPVWIGRVGESNHSAGPAGGLASKKMRRSPLGVMRDEALFV
jgi:hypothetical protein